MNNAILDAIIDQPFNGWFSYSSVPDQSSYEHLGLYNQNASISVTLGTQTYTSIDQYSHVALGNDGPLGDFFTIYRDGIDATGKYDFTPFGVDLYGHDLTTFTDESLPISLNSSDFDSMKFFLRGQKWSNLSGAYTDSFDIIGTVTNVTPEPASLMLLGFGGLALLRKNRCPTQ